MNWMVCLQLGGPAVLEALTPFGAIRLEPAKDRWSCTLHPVAGYAYLNIELPQEDAKRRAEAAYEHAVDRAIKARHERT